MVKIKRTFNDIPAGKVTDIDLDNYLVTLGLSKGYTWDDLLCSKRVLIVSEAGAGKTYECRMQAKRLWDNGEAAFFIELASLATNDPRSLLGADEEARLDSWLFTKSANEVATFFLDSIDELKLTRGTFESALNRLKKLIGGQLHRARIIITTRPTPFDEKLVRTILPVPMTPSSDTNEEVFAKVAMLDHRFNNGRTNNESPDWRRVTLMSLSDKLIVEFCRNQGVSNPELLFDDLFGRDALEFARRPQDLIELCVDWQEHKCIRTHREQLATNVRVKLLPREERHEPAEISADKAFEGSSRLAFAIQMTRRLTIRHSAAADTVNEDPALDPGIILSDWQPSERKALLERPLFGFASYGRVRFHHRSVTEYLAANHLVTLRNNGMSLGALKRIIFVENSGKLIVRPSKRAVAGWLALKETRIFEILRDNDPSVILNEGDPESLTPSQRKQALRAFAERHGVGGWRGLQVPSIQVHRFASKDLAEEIKRIWSCGIENPDVRQILVSIIEAGKIEDCSSIVYDIALDNAARTEERNQAINALASLGDERLKSISASMTEADSDWPESIIRFAVLILFPDFMSVAQLCKIIQNVKTNQNSPSDLSFQLPTLISDLTLEYSVLHDLRDNLLLHVSKGLKWDERLQLTSDHPEFNRSLAATCVLGVDKYLTDEWLHASVIALRLEDPSNDSDESIKSLSERLLNLDAETNERLFWIVHSLYQSLNETNDPWEMLQQISITNFPVQLSHERDLVWVSKALGDRTRNATQRATLLEAAIRLPLDREKCSEHVEGLRPLIMDEISFVQKIDEWLKPSPGYLKQLEWQQKDAERRKQAELRKLDILKRWIVLWRKVANQPEDAFSTKEYINTAISLWRAMRNQDGDTTRSGWNRGFIESHFSKEIAEKYRQVLMRLWREERPTFPRERKNDRGIILKSWQIGLTGIFAEAEDPDWSTKLSDLEAELATRYVPLASGIPLWLEQLGDTHPHIVDRTIGNELSFALTLPSSEDQHWNLLQSLSYSKSRVVKLFLPRLEDWLEVSGRRTSYAKKHISHVMTERIRQATDIIVQHGNAQQIHRLQKQALQRLEQPLPISLSVIWLSTLMRIDPTDGVNKLADLIEEIVPSKLSDAVKFFSALFGDRRDVINLSDKRFTPKLLLRLLRMAYGHVLIQDDAHDEESSSIDTRYEAERARDNIVLALFNLKGEEGLLAKLEMAKEPKCAHFKDRILAVAENCWAQEIDALAFEESQVVSLELEGDAPATTNEAMFSIMKDRLSDLEELLLSDESPRELWAGISEEKIMRRAIARELTTTAKSVYKVDQEGVTADEKETDIRLSSVSSNHEAVIELKLADNRSARDLRDTIENQLVKKYMAAEFRKAGALLVTLSKERQWEHPDDGHKINVDELVSLLTAEADRVQQAYGGGTYLYVHLLDLRPRLTTEAKANR